MAEFRILRGGIKGAAPVRQRAAVREMPQEAPQQEEETPEGWVQYAGRNIAQVPGSLYKLARSGLGAGNLLEMLNRKFHGGFGPEGNPQPFEEVSEEELNPLSPNYKGGAATANVLRYLLPTYGQAEEELASLGVPDYANRSRPGDQYTQFALTELPIHAATVGLGSLPKLGAAALSSLGLLGGSELGRNVGGAIGSALGDEEIGEFLGGAGGGYAGAKAARLAANRPSKKLAPKVAEQGTPFEAAKKEKISTVRKRVADRRNELKALDESRRINYNQAQKLEGNTRGSAKDIIDTVHEVNDNISHGVNKADRKLIADNLQAVDRATRGGNASLEAVKQLQKNFNDQIYNFGVSNSVKRYMNKITGSLNEFIKEHGSPEHNKAWQEAEAATRKIKEAQRSEKEFNRTTNEEIRDLKQQQDPEQTISAITKLANKVTGKLGTGALLAAASHVLGLGKLGTVITGTLSGIGRGVAHEISIARSAFKTHPELYREYQQFIRDIPKMDKTRAAAVATRLTKKLESVVADKEQKKSPGSFKIVRGGLK